MSVGEALCFAFGNTGVARSEVLSGRVTRDSHIDTVIFHIDTVISRSASISILSPCHLVDRMTRSCLVTLLSGSFTTLSGASKMQLGDTTTAAAAADDSMKVDGAAAAAAAAATAVGRCKLTQ